MEKKIVQIASSSNPRSDGLGFSTYDDHYVYWQTFLYMYDLKLVDKISHHSIEIRNILLEYGTK